MISPTLDSLRIFIHVVAAAVWVGGQIVLAGIVPALRKSHPQALGVVARGFARVAWPAFVVSVITGMWNILDTDITALDSTYHFTLAIKIGLVALTGLAAAAHSASPSKVVIAVGGALGLLAALAASYFGILLAYAH